MPTVNNAMRFFPSPDQFSNLATGIFSFVQIPKGISPLYCDFFVVAWQIIPFISDKYVWCGPYPAPYQRRTLIRSVRRAVASNEIYIPKQVTWIL